MHEIVRNLSWSLPPTNTDVNHLSAKSWEEGKTHSSVVVRQLGPSCCMVADTQWVDVIKMCSNTFFYYISSFQTVKVLLSLLRPNVNRPSAKRWEEGKTHSSSQATRPELLHGGRTSHSWCLAVHWLCLLPETEAFSQSTKLSYKQLQKEWMSKIHVRSS